MRLFVKIAMLSVLLTVIFTGSATPLYAGVSAGVREALARSVEELGLQTELPRRQRDPVRLQQPPHESHEPPPSEELKEPRPMDDRRETRPSSMGSNAATVTLIGAMIAIFIVVGMNFRDNLWSVSRSRTMQAVSGTARDVSETVTRMESAQSSADRLAQSGDFAGAMHMLLLQSVGELRRHLYVSIADSLTSREILHQVSLSPMGREAFADIIGRVEVSHFGTRQVGKEDYAACRSSFDALVGALRQGGYA